MYKTYEFSKKGFLTVDCLFFQDDDDDKKEKDKSSKDVENNDNVS